MSNIIVTNTPNVEGYVITDYLGSVSGAATYLLGGAFGEGLSDSRQSAMVSNAFQTAIRQMKTEARGADAIVGLQHTLCGVSNGYMIVSVTGTAVKLFTIAGPVIVFGTLASAAYGIVLVLLGYGG